MSEGGEGSQGPTAGRKDVRTLARGGALTLLGSVSQAAFGLILLIALGRILGTAGSGAFLEAIAIFNIAAVTATLGVDTGFIRSIPRLEVLGRGSDLPRTLWVGYLPVVAVGLAVAVLVALKAEDLAAVLARGEESEQVAMFLRAMIVFVPFGALLLVTLGATRAFETMLPTVAIDRLAKLGGQALLVLGALMVGLSGPAVAVAWGLPVVLALIWAVLWLRRLIKPPGKDTDADPVPLRGLIREFWAFTLPRTFASIFRVVILWLDVLLVGALISTSAAGIYAVSTRLLQVGIAVAFAVGQVSQPMISRLIVASGRAETNAVYGTATAWQMLLTWPQYLALAIFADSFLGIFGPGFTEGSIVVVILAASAMIGSAAGPVDMVLLMAGKSLWSFWNTGLALTINIALNLILIPHLGISGAAVAWAISRIAANIVPLVQLMSAFGIHPWGAKWLRAAIASALVFGVGGIVFRTLVGSNLTSTLGFLALGSVVYAAVLFRWRKELDLHIALSAFRKEL